MKTLINRLRRHHTGTGYGWTCPPCRINAGDPDNPFPTAFDAALGLHRHIDDSHDGNPPGGSFSGEITWGDN